MGPALSVASSKAIDLAEKLPLVRERDVYDGQVLGAGVPCDADAVCIGCVLVHLLHGKVAVGDPHSSTSRTTLRFRDDIV